jgi:hypothetical protein
MLATFWQPLSKEHHILVLVTEDIALLEYWLKKHYFTINRAHLFLLMKGVGGFFFMLLGV